MEHFAEAFMALIWVILGSELRGRRVVDRRYRAFRITHYGFHSKEYYFENYVGELASSRANQEFQVVEKTFQRGDIVLHCRWMGTNDLKVTYSFGHRQRVYEIQFQNGGQEMIIYDDDKSIEGRADMHQALDLSYVKIHDQSGRELGFRIQPY